MKQVLCVWLPNWPIQRIRNGRPELKQCPVILHTESGGRAAQVVACSHAAAQQGVTVGMPVAEARSLLGTPHAQSAAPHFEVHDPWADRTALRTLAHSCQQFTPVFGIAESETADSLLLNTSGCAHLFGGEQRLAERVLQSFRERGYRIRVAIAATVGTAWAAAHYARIVPGSGDQPRSQLSDALVISREQQAAVLQSLPVAALRLPANVVRLLNEFDIRHIGRLQKLPRADLPSRFGPLVLERLDQALGNVSEMFVPETPPEPIQAERAFEFPLRSRQALETVVGQLIEQIVAKLKRRHEGTQHLLCRLDSSNRQTLQFSTGLVHPSDSATHLFELVQLKMAQLDLPTDVAQVRVQATAAGMLVSRQQELFERPNERKRTRELHVLVDRLSSRLGARAVLRPRLWPDARPEHASRYEALIADGRGLTAAGSVRSDNRSISQTIARQTRLYAARPLGLNSEPVAVDVRLAIPGGAPVRFRCRHTDHTVARSWGPERIETAWWSDQPVHRDYYRVETKTGNRFWLFRRIREGDWFLHGVFD